MRFLRHSLTGLFLLSLTLGLLTYAGYAIFAAVQERIASESEVPERRERVFAVNVETAVVETITPVLKAVLPRCLKPGRMSRTAPERMGIASR